MSSPVEATSSEKASQRREHSAATDYSSEDNERSYDNVNSLRAHWTQDVRLAMLNTCIFWSDP